MRGNMDEVPDLVRDSRLETRFEGNVTVHERKWSPKGLGRFERWIRDQRIGRGGGGLVFLERRQGAGDAVSERAVKEITPYRPGSYGGEYRLELLAIAKFSQEKVCSLLY
jgi:hypothetical protein